MRIVALPHDPDVVALDADGVLLDFDAPLPSWLEQRFGSPHPVRDPQAYRISRRYGLSESQSDRAWEFLVKDEAFWSTLPALPGAVAAVHALQQAGKRVVVVTGILPQLEAWRLANLHAHGIEVEAVECVGLGTACKNEALMRWRPAAFVDDRLFNLHKAAFIPDRVWIDCDQDQDGHVVDDTIIHATRLESWVSHWLTHSPSGRR